MFKKLLFTMMLATFGISMFAAVTGETPASGSSYYIYNVGQQKYLTVSGNTVSLGTSGTEFAVSAGTTSGTYTLTASETLSSNFNGDVICSNEGWYTDWKFSLLSSTDKTYALGLLEDEDAYSFSYLYYSTALGSVGNSPIMPSFADGQWIFTTGGTSEVTYTVTVSPLEDMAYNATSATVNYTVTASTGESYNCTKDVTFAANDTYEAVTRSGEFTDATYNVKVSWSLKLGAKPVTYSLGSVDDLGTLDYTATQATVTYTIHPSYGNDIKCTHDVTFEANDTYSVVTRSGEFTDDTYNVTVTWSLYLAAKSEPSSKVTEVILYQNNTSYSKPDNMESTVDVYLYRSPLKAGKRCSFSVPFDMTYAQIKAAFGSTVKLYAYRTYSSTYNTIYYATRSTVQAGVPYIVVASSDTESSEETAAREANTELTDTDARLYIIKDVPSSSFVSSPSSVTHSIYTYYANFVDQTISAPYYTFNESTGVLTKYTSNSELKGFHAYFKSSSSNAKELSDVNFEFEDATGINSINADDESLDVYNLSGQMVKNNATSTKDLPRGMYIINGKKVVVK